MPLYNFQERFAEYVIDGTKVGTIRAFRKVPPQVGQLAHLYTGLRTKYAKKLIDPSPVIRAVHVIKITDTNIFLWRNALPEDIVGRDPLALELECDELAWYDGFRHEVDDRKHGCYELMMRYWKGTHALPFVGNFIIWGQAPDFLL